MIAPRIDPFGVKRGDGGFPHRARETMSLRTLEDMSIAIPAVEASLAHGLAIPRRPNSAAYALMLSRTRRWRLRRVLLYIPDAIMPAKRSICTGPTSRSLIDLVYRR